MQINRPNPNHSSRGGQCLAQVGMVLRSLFIRNEHRVPTDCYLVTREICRTAQPAW